MDIPALRQKHYKNQTEVATKIGISVPAYSKIETGKVDLSYSRIKQIADLFKVSLSSLLPGEDIDPINPK